MDYITILGSCRQTPIENHFNVSQILYKLNYPHYTKEILQQIRYLKYKNIPNELTKYCFRCGLLSNCNKEITDFEYDIFKEDFDKSTFFLVEIASRISYKFNNLYLHHIAEEEKYNFTNSIVKEELSDEEIEDDIIQIRNELYPKPFIIISHFATYESGKRYELINLLKNICKKFGIPFLNQTDIVKQYSNDIIFNEPVLAHYTKEGLKFVGNVLFDKINEVKEKQLEIKNLYQVYYTSNNRVKKYTFHGFGDYIRGTIHLYQFLKNQGVNLKINFSNHNLSNYFVCDNHLSMKECEETKYIFGTGENFLDYKHVFTNNSSVLTPITEDCKDFVIKNCLTPRIGFEKNILVIKKKLKIEDYNYSVIHIRLNDDEVYNENRLNNILNIIYLIHNESPSENFILIASNEIYLNYINLPFIKKTNLNRGHVGLDTTLSKECEDTMIEFMLMKTCKKIFQLSVYGWGSGFSDTINKIYDIPIIKYCIKSLNNISLNENIKFKKI
jgi:hypothetical protein